MSAGDIFEVDDKLYYLQLGELQGCPDAPFVAFLTWEDDSNLYCQEALESFFIPKDWVKKVRPDYYYVSLSSESIFTLGLDTFNGVEPIDTLSPLQTQKIKDCVKKIGSLSKQNMRKFFP